MEAIEAAARKLCALAGYDWDNIGAPDDVAADFKAQITAQAKSILEAAAPHMQAGAQEAVDEMAKVIATHHLVDNDACDCNEMFYDTRLSAAQIVIEHGLHVAMELHNAGFDRPTP